MRILVRKLENLFGHIATLSVEIDPTATIQQIKTLIATHLHLPSEQFALKLLRNGEKVHCIVAHS